MRTLLTLCALALLVILLASAFVENHSAKVIATLIAVGGVAYAEIIRGQRHKKIFYRTHTFGFVYEMEGRKQYWEGAADCIKILCCIVLPVPYLPESWLNFTFPGAVFLIACVTLFACRFLAKESKKNR